MSTSCELALLTRGEEAAQYDVAIDIEANMARRGKTFFAAIIVGLSVN